MKKALPSRCQLATRNGNLQQAPNADADVDGDANAARTLVFNRQTENEKERESERESKGGRKATGSISAVDMSSCLICLAPDVDELSPSLGEMAEKTRENDGIEIV